MRLADPLPDQIQSKLYPILEPDEEIHVTLESDLTRKAVSSPPGSS